jgi:hypothetical protein
MKLNMQKRLLLIVAGIVVLLVPLVAFLGTQQTSQKANITAKSSNAPDQNTVSTGNNGSNGSAINSQTATPAQEQSPLTAEEAAKQFYKYYFAAPTNPLANGAYKDNKYLSQGFKDVIHDLYKDGDTPVFCAKNVRPNIVVGKDRQVYTDNEYVTQVVISEAPPGTKDLYRVEMENITGEWLVYDINCIR